jgi:hypothetical protein
MGGCLDKNRLKLSELDDKQKLGKLEDFIRN